MQAVRALLLAAPLAAAAGCYPQNVRSTQSGALRNVDVLEVRAEPAVDELTLVGRIEPVQEATLYFEVPGIVRKVLVHEGDTVPAGAPLAELVPDDFTLALAQANAEAAAARARWDLLKAGTRAEDLTAARAAHAQSVARTAFWTAELARRRNLFRKNTISASDLDEAQREFEASTQRERETKALLEKAIAGPRKEELAEAAAAAQARAEAAATARRQLDKATLRAPFAGRVERRMVDAGALVQLFPSGGVPVLHLLDLAAVEAVIAVPEALRPRFEVGQPVEVASAVDRAARGQGEVVSLGQVAERASGAYELRVRLDNASGVFQSGMVVTAASRSLGRQPLIRVPATAVRQPFGQSPQVLLVDPQRSLVLARDLRLGPLQGERFEVHAGLKGGELLIVRGQHLVVAGDLVRARRISTGAGGQREAPRP